MRPSSATWPSSLTICACRWHRSCWRSRRWRRRPRKLPPANRALQDADYLTGLVENLHQGTRLRHGLDPTEGEVDLRDVVSRLEVRFRALGRVDDVEVGAVVPEVPVRVQCTPALAERAISNLLQNAMTHGGQHVAVSLTVGEGRFRLVVLDDGDGISEADCVDLSRRTFLTDPARRRGPGLGVAITNEIARRAGFTIEYAQGEGGGLMVALVGRVIAPHPPRDG